MDKTVLLPSAKPKPKLDGIEVTIKEEYTFAQLKPRRSYLA
jgi:hypothetical protein